MLTACTLTGVDEKTDIDRLLDLSAQHPIVEWGLLVSLTRCGVDPRYMRIADIERVVDRIQSEGSGIKTALHLCGRSVGMFLNGDAGLRCLASRFGRVQINFNALVSRDITPELIDAALEDFGRPIITQHNAGNFAISTSVSAPRHHVLIDASGGRGVRADTWPAPFPGKLTGYAGGIGPRTIEEDFERALAAAGVADTWIDMEGMIRTDDWFDLDLCEQVLEAVNERALLTPSAG